MLNKQLYDATDADLFLAVQTLKPAGEFVGTLDVPRHIPQYATRRIMRQGL